jgi:hypothetical protein
MFTKSQRRKEMSFEQEMDLHRILTLLMAGFIDESKLPADLITKLNAYEQAYKKMYLEKWGEAGPKGSSLRYETDEETSTYFEWLSAYQEYKSQIEAAYAYDDDDDEPLEQIDGLDF